MLFVLLWSAREDEYVVEISNAKDVKMLAKDILDEGLEGGRGIRETVGHHQMLEETKGCSKGGLPLITVLDVHMRVRGFEVDDGEDLRALDAVEEVIHEG